MDIIILVVTTVHIITPIPITATAHTIGIMAMATIIMTMAIDISTKDNHFFVAISEEMAAFPEYFRPELC